MCEACDCCTCPDDCCKAYVEPPYHQLMFRTDAKNHGEWWYQCPCGKITNAGGMWLHWRNLECT